MTPAARLAATIEVLDAALAGPAPADRVLADWGRAHRFAGSGDRAAIADRLYRCLRRLRSLGWRMVPAGSGPARAAVIGSVIEDGADPAALFGHGPHAPPALTAAEQAALAAAPVPMPDPVAFDYPDWLDRPLRDSLGAEFEPAMRALRERAPVDMRVNTLRSTLAAARQALANDGVPAEPLPGFPAALRAPPGSPVARTRAYAEGAVELQDAASQAVAALAAAQPGETVLDFCAGGGGKTLALAAAMQGRGRLMAHDVDARRLRDLPARAARAGATVEIVPTRDLPALAGTCDLVFVDAPCSGSGSWRRDPGGKWRLTPARLAELAALQSGILAEAALCLRPGGRLAYATCSVLDAENGQGERHFGRPPAARLRLTPAAGTDGFFCGVWTSCDTQ